MIMKKLLLLFLLAFVVNNISQANPYGHRYATEQSTQDITVDINTSFTVSVEWGEGDWDGAMGSAFGYGISNDGTDWTWVQLPWFEDGSGSNKRCRTDVSISIPGKYYYAYRMIKAANGGTTYSFGSDGWLENSSTLVATSTIIVGEVSAQAGDWSSTTSWIDGTVPTSSDNVAIMHNIVISTSGANANDVYIYSGKSLTMNPASELTANGTFTNNGTLTLQSDATGTASLIESTAGVTATTQNYKTSNRWHYISLPVAETTANSFYGMYLMHWYEPTEDWIYITDETTVLDTVMQGFSFWTYSNTTLSYTGELNSGAYSIGVTNNMDYTAGSSGMNFIGNPYPSATNWNLAGWALNDVDPTIYIYMMVVNTGIIIGILNYQLTVLTVSYLLIRDFLFYVMILRLMVWAPLVLTTVCACIIHMLITNRVVRTSLLTVIFFGLQ